MTVPRLIREDAQLLVVDIQERLCAAMPADSLERMVGRTRALIEGAKVLGLPIHVTEQYPKGLGHTLPQLAVLLGGAKPVEKTEFTACVAGIADRLGGRKVVLVAGMEAHICVFQTVRDLAERGFSPVLCVDAVLSRSEVDLRVGIDLCRQAGAFVTTAESALFDMLGRAGTPEFKAISAAVK